MNSAGLKIANFRRVVLANVMRHGLYRVHLCIIRRRRGMNAAANRLGTPTGNSTWITTGNSIVFKHIQADELGQPVTA